MTQSLKGKMSLIILPNTQTKKMGTSSSPKILLLPLNLSPEQALKMVKAYFGIGKKVI